MKKKLVICLETGEQWASLREAANQNLTAQSIMFEHLHGRIESVDKLHYKYVDTLECNKSEVENDND